MNRICRISRIGLAAAVALAAAAGLAEGAWLVTTDGARIETRGPWQVREGLVVFTNTGGVLSSVRLSKCDLEASRAATAAAARAVVRGNPKAPPPLRRPVLVLTDADVEHVRPEPVPDEGGEEEAEEEEPAAAEPPAAGAIVVSDWQPNDEEGGIAITGTIRNDSANVAGRIQLATVFRDADGELIENRPATLSTSTLAPGQRARFRVPPFGLFGYSKVEFEIQHLEILSGRDDAEAAPAGRE